MKILRELEDLYVIRSDKRQEATWYELSHDQLIDVVLKDNESSGRPRLEPWQLAARQWEHTDDPQLLLRGAALRAAPAANSRNLTDTERSFLKASKRAEHLLARTRAVAFTSSAVILIQTVIIVTLLSLLFAVRR